MVVFPSYKKPWFLWGYEHMGPYNGDVFHMTRMGFFFGFFIWVCLKIGYIPNYSHLIGIMISKTIGFRGTLFSDKPIFQTRFSERLLGRLLGQIHQRPTFLRSHVFGS